MTDIRPPLIIAAHGSRDPGGVAVCRALGERVAAALPDVAVSMGFVELAEPSVTDAIRAALDGREPRGDGEIDAVVVPLMVTTGGHVQQDIPEFIEEARGEHHVVLTPPLAPDVRLRLALERRLREALEANPGWDPRDVAGVLVGRGAMVPEANAEHYRLSRMVSEDLGLASVHPGFIQVTRPSVPEALNAAVVDGATQVLVGQNFLFPGKLRTWLSEQVGAWQESHPGVEVRIAEVIGDTDELAGIVVDRYREQLDELGLTEGAPVYLSGLRLQGRDVLVVGAGHVAERRIVRLLDAGARVTVVAPNAGIKVARMAKRGEIAFEQRAFADADLDGKWFVQALTNDPTVNARVAELAEQQRIFCVRGDKASDGTAYTPATAEAGGVTVSVVGHRTPRRSARLRDELLKALQG